MFCERCGQPRIEGAPCERCGVPVPSPAAGPVSPPAGPVQPDSAAAARALVLSRRAGLALFSLIYLLLFLQRSAARPGSRDGGAGPADFVQAASQATVLIQSPWGEGSGFFIDAGGRVVTNKHVVAMDAGAAEKLKQERGQLAMALQIADAFSQDPSSPEPPRSGGEGTGGAPEVRKRIAEIDGLLKRYWEEKQAPRITVKTSSEKEFVATSVQTSAKHDLALLRISCGGSPSIPLAKSSALRLGEQVYAIGNPLGIRRTVSAGVVSGPIVVEGETYIQTDVPINPGNSGGPLISPGGEVVGVNTMIVANAQGLSFSIPIETVRREFGLGP
jgi:serine protease Do